MPNDKQREQHFSKYLNNSSMFAEDKERFRTLIENIPGAVYRCAFDQHWTMAFISSAIETITGFGAEDFIDNRTRSYASIIHPDDVEPVENKVLAAVNDRQPFVLHYRIIDAQKQIKWVYEKGRACYNKDNVPMWLDGVIFDYTDQYIAQRHLETEVAQLLSIFDSMDEVIYIADPTTYNLLYGNEVFRRNWGEPVGQKCYRALQGRDTPCPFCTNDKIFGENLGKTYIWEFQNELNHRWYRCIDRAIKWTDGTMVRFEMAIDNHDLKVTQLELDAHREHLEKLVEERTLQLEISKKKAEAANQAKSDFLARMSHELRTPLNAILGYAQLFLRRQLNDDLEKGVVTIQQSGEHLLRLINDILDTAKIEAGKVELSPEPLELDTFFESLIGVIRSRGEAKGLRVVLERGTPFPIGVLVDATRLRQVLLNLLNNATKFTDIGSVILRVSCRDTASSVPEEKPPESLRLQIEVTDTGIGIDPDQISRIFTPFEQVSEPVQRIGGTGLGLYISRQLVSLMGGELQVESEPGRGSTFSFEINVPTTQVPADSIGADERNIVGYHGPKRKALVVDDIDSNRAFLADMLKQVGFEVVEAADGRMAITSTKEEKPDIILMDRYMPELDGLTTLRELRKMPQMQKIPAIAISASVSERDRDHILGMGYDGFISKPVRWKTLAEQLQTHLNIRWKYGKNKALLEKDIFDIKTLAVPSKDDLREFLELVKQGDMEAIVSRAGYFENLGDQYSPFYDRLRRLAHGFEDEQIHKLLRQCMAKEP